MTVGAFGDMSGGQPNVRMCSASVPNNGTSDEWCATFGYMWTTGEISGAVGEESGHTVTVEPETGHGAISDDTKSGSGGAYSITGLQDGMYSATATLAGQFSLATATPALKEGLAVYHDEYKSNKDEEKADSAWAGARGHANHTWNTVKGGLSIKGFIGNDGEDGEEADNLLRGDERKAGVPVSLKRGAATVASTETDATGMYSFDDLNEGNYTVVAGSISNAKALKGFKRRSATSTQMIPDVEHTAKAQNYRPFPDEQELDKPQWLRSTNSMPDNGSTSTYTTGTVTNTLYNFALVYTDGQLSGKVDNLSSADDSGIDMDIFSPIPDDDDREVETGAGGLFEVHGLMEGNDYEARIQDAGYASPCMDGPTAAAKPDDDGPADGDGNCTTVAPTSLMATIEGEDDHEALGTLYVYSSRASTDDSLGAGVAIRGGNGADGEAQTNNYDTTSTWGAGWTRTDAGDPTTPNTASIGTTSYKSRAVTVVFGTRNGAIPTGASVEVTFDSTGATGTSPAACSGYTCTLLGNATDAATGAGTERENKITVTVTAANGYNDHVYSTVVTVAAPVGNTMGNTTVRRVVAADLNDAVNSAGAGTASDEFTLSTASSTASSLILHIDQTFRGGPDNRYCPQSVVVKEEASGTVVPAMTQHRVDECPNERYELKDIPAGGAVKDYLLEITSEDGKKATYYLEVSRGA